MENLTSSTPNIIYSAREVRGQNIWLISSASSTVLGIVFGVASVGRMFAIGEGASFEAREKIKELGATISSSGASTLSADANSNQTSSLNVRSDPTDLSPQMFIPSVETIVPTWK